jgi:hypothetical protein
VWKRTLFLTFSLDASLLEFIGDPLTSLPLWIKGILTPHSSFSIPLANSHLFQIYVVVLCDMLWFSKNQAIHNGVIPDVSMLAANINRISLEHYTTWTTISNLVRELWSPSSTDIFKVNFDAAIRELFSVKAAICRNFKGQIIKIFSQVRPPCNPTYGKAQTAILAVSLAASFHLENFILEGDSSIVILALQHPSN